MADGGQPLPDQCDAVGRAIFHLAEDQRISQTGHAQSDTALGLGLGTLFFQREARDINRIVQHADGGGDQSLQFRHVHGGVVGEPVAHQPGQVDGPQQTGAIGRQRLFAARIGGGDRFAIAQIVLLVDAVNKDHARLGIIIGGPHDAVPQRPGPDGAIGLAAEYQRPVGIGGDGLHEGIAHKHRQIEIAQPPRRALGGDEIFHIGMIHPQGRHHGAAARTGAHDGLAHGIPHIHERDRAGGIRAHALHGCALGPQGGKVITDAAALLQRQRRFAQGAEDAIHRIGDGAHDETVEQRHVASGARACEYPACRQEFVACQGMGEILRARGALIGRFGLRQGQRHARPAVRHIGVHGRAVRLLQPVLHVPDILGNRAHGEVTTISDGGSPLS